MSRIVGTKNYQFLEIVWSHEPIHSGELSRLAEEKLGWNKSTSYTVLRRLAEQGILQNKNSQVTSLVSEEEIQQNEVDHLLNKVFNGSVFSLVSLLTDSKKLTRQEADKLKKMIEQYEVDE